MYNLEVRKFMPKIGDTPDNVAANTYILDEYKDRKQNFAPFLSDTPRGFAIGKEQYTNAIYNATLPRHIKGGSSLKNKSQRTFFTTDDNPGPADYDPIKMPRKKPLPDNTPPPGKGKLYLCKPPGHVQAVGPSVPTKIDENGYYVNDRGNLEKIPRDTFDTTLGPAFYNVPTQTCYTTLRYKGCQWSNRTASRDTAEPSKGPGPGSYNVHIETMGQLNQRDEYVREMARLFSYVPRTIEAAELNTIKENMPGPGYYHVDSSNLENNNRSMSIKPRPFVAGSKRFTSIETDTPPPNTYRLRECLYKRKNFSLKEIPFGVNSRRFPKKTSTVGPGPAGYNVKGVMEEKFNKRKFHSTVEAPFNITAIRKLTVVEDDVLFMPGPANYLVEPLEIERTGVKCCHFKSKSERFPRAKQSENAEPATYSISETFNKTRNRTSHNTGKVPFQSTQPKGLDLGVQDYPSPDKYRSHNDFGRPILSLNRAPRFPDRDEDFPGPGTYNIHPSFEDSVYRSIATHNLRLKESVLRTKLRLPPGTTWESWYKELRKKKKLRAFIGEDKNAIDYVTFLFGSSM